MKSELQEILTSHWRVVGSLAHDSHGNQILQPTTATEAPLRQEPIAVAGDKRKRDDDDEQIEEGEIFFMSEDG